MVFLLVGKEYLGLSILLKLIFLPHVSRLHQLNVTCLTWTIIFLYHSDQQWIVYNVVSFKKCRVIFYNLQYLLSLWLLQIYRFSLLKIVVFFGRAWVLVQVLSPIRWSFYIISFYDPFLSIENISHDNKIAPTYLFSTIVFLNEFMKPKEFSDHCLRVLL